MRSSHKHEILHSLIFAFMLITRVSGSHDTGQALELLENLRQQLDRPLLLVVRDESISNPKALDDLSDDDDDNNNVYSRNDERDQNFDGSSNDEIDENRAYLLYSLLRTREEDGSAPEEFSEAKQALRAALIGRCRNLDVCNDRCSTKPKTKKYECKVTCQEVFDDLDVCGTVKPKKQDDCSNTCFTPSCEKKCRGRTMPPKWRLLRSLLQMKK